MTNYRPVLVTAPTAPPVTIEEAQRHCRIDGSDEDALLSGLIVAATALFDGYGGLLGGRCIVSQGWRQDFDGFCVEMRLPLLPAASVTSVKYDDAEDAEQTVDAANYQLLADENGAFIRFNSGFSLPATGGEKPAVRITCTYGTGAANVPGSLKQMILLLVGHWYASREAVVVGVTASELPLAVSALLEAQKRMSV